LESRRVLSRLCKSPYNVSGINRTPCARLLLRHPLAQGIPTQACECSDKDFKESVRSRADERERAREREKGKGRGKGKWPVALGASRRVYPIFCLFKYLCCNFEALIKNVLEKFPCCVLLRAGLRQFVDTSFVCV